MTQLSFIIPAYNSSKYIVRCIESIYNQNLEVNSFEVIVVDDGSTDDTKSIVENLIADGQHKNLHLISQINSGPSVARNNGLNVSEGKYVWFVDSDDYIEELSISKLISLINSNEPDILFFELTQIDVDSKTSRRACSQSLVKNSVISGKEAIINGFNPASACSAIIRRDFLIGNKLYFKHGLYNEDTELMYRAVALSKSVIFTDFAPYIYELHQGGRLTSEKPEVLIKRISDNAIIAKSFYDFSKTVDHETGKVIRKKSKSISFGTIWDFYKSKYFSDPSIREPILNVFRRNNQFPLLPPYNSWKQALASQFLNLIFCLYR